MSRFAAWSWAVGMFLGLLTGRGLVAAPVVQIGPNFTGATYGVDSVAVPSDGGGWIGPQHYVELINGRFSVFDKGTGSRVVTMTDLAFWTKAGVTFPQSVGITDPRIVFDPGSQRWFASMVDFNLVHRRQQGNRFLLAVSESADPLGTWDGFAFAADPVGGYFADFPTLGFDAHGVYLSGDLFDPRGNSIGPVLATIPKSSLLAATPTTTGLQYFDPLTYQTRGSILQPAMTFGAATTEESVLAVGNLGYDSLPHSTLVASIIQNATTPGGASLSAPTTLTVPPYVVPLDPTQPDGSQNLDDGDTRFSASVQRLGDLLYAVQSVEANYRAAVRWYKIDAVHQSVVQSGTLNYGGLDLFYPSIAANAAGTVVIACNGSSSNRFVSGFAFVGSMNNGSLTFGTPILLKPGTASYQNPDTTGVSRWGDYTSTSVDPVDPNRFWTLVTVPTTPTVWATQITELTVNPLSLKIGLANTNVVVSWPAAATGVQLQHVASLQAPVNWQTVSQTPVIQNQQATVSLPIADGAGFFRLVQP